MRVTFTPHGWADYTHWLTADRNNVKRIIRLTGAWSRRTTDEHRLVYLVSGDDLAILQARYQDG